MGAVQSIPLVGEAVTVIDSGVKLVAAGACAITGEILDDEDAKKAAKTFVEDAGKTWVEYSERNVIAAPIRATVHAVDNKPEEALRVLGKMGHSVEQVVDNTPVVGHAKGVVHYIGGDTEHGDNCMKGASRSVAVLGAGALTGGVGGGAVLGGFAAVTGGVAYDTTVSVIESNVKDKDCPYGVIQSIDQVIESDKKRDGHGVISGLIDIGYATVGDFAAGAAAAKTAKSVKESIKAKKQRNALGKKVGKEGVKDVVDTAKELKSKTKDVKGDNHVCTKTKNLETGETKYGYNRRCRVEMRKNEFAKKGKASGYRSKTNAAKGHLDEFSREAGVLENAANETNMEINSVSNRAPRACAEHHSFNKLGTHGGESNIRTSSVMKTKGQFVTVERCGNCKQYGNLMGNVITDDVAGMPVPTTEFSKSSVALAGVAVIFCTKCGAKKCENEECHTENKKD
ncbi:Hypothetical predicted protein [Paramuricea clavata]|uniref:Uncharacterized protein n=1 Tax=Paramuricea clavata TaxID=317549 RepID=A0A7D9JK01_PARCT|nr:Hypothetical predicted protein [Paramuricea clavata]